MWVPVHGKNTVTNGICITTCLALEVLNEGYINITENSNVKKLKSQKLQSI